MYLISSPLVDFRVIVRRCVPFRLFANSWTLALQAPLTMGFPRQEYWSGLAFPSPSDLPNPLIQLLSLASPALAEAGRFFMKWYEFILSLPALLQQETFKWYVSLSLNLKKNDFILNNE